MDWTGLEAGRGFYFKGAGIKLGIKTASPPIPDRLQLYFEIQQTRIIFFVLDLYYVLQRFSRW